MDFSNRRLRFQDPSHFVKPPEAFELPLWNDGTHRLTEILLEGGRSVPLEVDLGFGGTLQLNPDLVRNERLLVGRSQSEGLFFGADGIPQTETNFVLKEIGLGHTMLQNVPVSMQNEAPLGPANMRGLLGLEILRRYRVIFDYPGDRLYLITDMTAVNQPFKRDHLGVSMVPDGENIMLIKLVSPGSPADRSNLKPGDRVIGINGQPASRQSYLDAARSPVGTTIGLTLENKDVRFVTLEEFY